MTLNLTRRFILVAILLLAAGLRLYRLDHQSFWNDEGNSARLSERSVSLIIEGTASDVHPPLYYLMLRGWRDLVGASEFGLRALSVMVGVLLVAGGMAVARPLNVSPEGVGLFLALSPALVYYSQEARMYSLLGLLGVVAVLAVVKWWESPGRAWAIAYVLIATAGLYTHYAFPFLLIGLNVWIGLLLAIAWGRHGAFSQIQAQLIGWSLMQVAVLALYGPWLPIFLRNGGRASDPGSLIEFIEVVANWLIIGRTLDSAGVWLWIIWGIVVLGYAGLIRRRWEHAALVGLVILFPIGLMYVLGATAANFLKFMTMVVPIIGLLFVASWGFFDRFGRLWKTVAVLITLLIVTWPISRSLNNLYSNPLYFRDDYRSLAAQVSADAHPDAAVLLNAPNQWEVFTYYYDGPAEIHPYPKFIQPDEATTAGIEAIAAENERIYAIFWGSEGFDPNRAAERWLDDNTFKAIDEFRGDLRFVIYAVPQTVVESMETARFAVFGEDQMWLDGWTAGELERQAGDIIEVTLFWRTERPLDKRYKIFLHLLNEDGVLVAQRDREPAGNTAFTTDWPINEPVLDPHGILIPLDLPPGEYQLVLGVYDAFAPDDRLTVEGGDSLPLLTVIVD